MDDDEEKGVGGKGDSNARRNRGAVSIIRGNLEAPKARQGKIDKAREAAEVDKSRKHTRTRKKH